MFALLDSYCYTDVKKIKLLSDEICKSLFLIYFFYHIQILDMESIIYLLFNLTFSAFLQRKSIFGLVSSEQIYIWFGFLEQKYIFGLVSPGQKYILGWFARDIETYLVWFSQDRSIFGLVSLIEYRIINPSLAITKMNEFLNMAVSSFKNGGSQMGLL